MLLADLNVAYVAIGVSVLLTLGLPLASRVARTYFQRGRVDTSDAGTLFEEARSMRVEQREEIAALRGEVTRLQTESSGLSEQVRRLTGELATRDKQTEEQAVVTAATERRKNELDVENTRLRTELDKLRNRLDELRAKGA